MGSKSYVNGDAVLPLSLLSRCQGALGGTFSVITFRAGGPYTKTEALLGSALAEECRAALGAGGRWRTQMSEDVYVPGQGKGGRPSKRLDAAVEWLVSVKGYSVRAVADVLGVPETTVTARVTQRRLTRGRPPELSDAPEVVEAGLRALRQKYRGAWGNFQSVPELAAAIGDVNMDDLWLRVIEAGNAYRVLHTRTEA